MKFDFIQSLTAVSALGAVFVSWWNSRKINEIHVSINSRMDQLIAATATAERAVGAKEERDRGST